MLDALPRSPRLPTRLLSCAEPARERVAQRLRRRICPGDATVGSDEQRWAVFAQRACLLHALRERTFRRRNEETAAALHQRVEPRFTAVAECEELVLRERADERVVVAQVVANADARE